MSIEVITKDDLQFFRMQLINDLKELLSIKQEANKKWLRSSEVRKMLQISPGTLQTLRVNGKLTPSKIGSIYYYSFTDIEKLLEINKG